MDEICMCGHGRERHLKWPGSGKESWCALCGGTKKSYHNFKLDNIKLIEDLAKEKGFI